MATPRILICDDKNFEALEYRQILEARKMKVVHICANGQELLEWLRANPKSVDLLLLDIVMPVVDGYAAFHELKQLEPELKVIFISVENSAPLIKTVLSMGALDFITRPIKRDALVERVVKALNR
ncbi:MAG: response regulator [Leptospiraceae bacterium]|nr:response regulator [Leptospiraceae bacterium]